MSLMEIAIWFAVSVFLVIRVAMLLAFIVLPIVIVKMIRRPTVVRARAAGK